MSDATGQRPSELAAQQVEQIVSAAQAAAEQIREEAHAEREDVEAEATREAEATIEETSRIAHEKLREAGKQAIILEKDARRDAEAILADAEHDAMQIREKAQRAVDGRVVAAERAAAEVLEEARALSAGLHQLGKALESHADRILRDVTAAHKRMQADLRVGGPEPEDGAANRGAAAGGEAAEDGASGASRRSGPTVPRARPQAVPDNAGAGRRHANPFEEIEVPSWIGRDD